MINGRTPADEGKGAGKAYSVHVHGKAQPSGGCSFCWFVLALYPTLRGLTERDSTTFRLHLQKVHGLRDEIQP